VNGATVVNGGSVNSGSHTQTYNGAVTVGGLATQTTTFTGVGMTFGSTLDGTSRVVVADSGNTTYTGAIGSVAAPAHFETDAAGSSKFSGGLVRTSSPNSIHIADDAVVTADTTFDTTHNGALATGANITFGKTLNSDSLGAHAVTLNAGTNGVVSVLGAVGNTYPVSTLTLVQSNGAVFNAPVTTSTRVVLTDTMDGQTIRFADNLSTPVLTTTANGYNLELLGTTTSVSAANTATTFLNTGNLVLGNGAGDSLTFAGGVTATAPAAISAAGTVNTTNTAMSLGDSDTALTLTANTTLSTGSGNITVGGTVNDAAIGTHSLTLDSTGVKTLLAAVGDTAALSSLTTNTGGTLVMNGGSVTTTGAQNYGEAITLGADTTLSAGAGNITLGGTVNDAVSGTHSLTINSTGVTTFAAALGNSAALSNVTTNAGGTLVMNGGSVTTTGAQSYGEAITLGADTTLSAGIGNITLGSTVNDATRGTHSLTLNSTGVTTFAAALGNNAVLNSVTTNTGGTLVMNGGSITTTGAQSYGEAITLGADTTLAAGAGNITLGSTVNDAISGAHSLTLNSTGVTTFVAALGNSAALNSVTTNTGGTLVMNGGSVTTTGAQSYGEAITLGADTTLWAGAGNITLSGTVNDAISGTHSLTLNSTGVTTLQAAVGNNAALNSVTTNTGGTLVMNGGSVTTTGAQSYGEVITLGADTTLDAGAGNIALGGTVNDAISGTHSLTLNSTGVTTFAAALGNSAALNSVTTNTGGTLVMNGGSVTTTGAQSYGEAITLGADTTLSAGAGNITLGSTVNDATSGSHSLTLNSTGVTTFAAALGNSAALNSVMTNAGGTLVMNGGSVTTTGAQSYGKAITLGVNTTLEAGAGAISFMGTVDGLQTLDVNSTGTTLFNQAVGATTPLSSLTTNTGGMVLIGTSAVHTTGAQTFNEVVSLPGHVSFTGSTITFNDAVVGAGDLNVVGAAVLNAGTISTSGAQNYNANVTLMRDTVLTAGVNGLRFASAVDGAYALTINTSGNTTFDGSIGNTTPLTSLTTDQGTGGRLLMNGGAVTTTGAQTYGEAITLGANTTLSSSGGGHIQLRNTVNGAKDLVVNTSGLTTFNGAVGLVTPLTSVSTDAGGSVVMNAGSVMTSGAQTYLDAMTLGAHTRLTSSDATLNFLRVEDGTNSFNLNLQTHTALVLGDVDIGGNLQVATQAGGVSQTTSSNLNVGGLSTFTADTGVNQVAALTSANNVFTGQLNLNQINQGSWANVSVTTNAPLNLGPLQSAGSVTLQTHGALITSTMAVSGNLSVSSNGGAVSLGQTSVTGHMSIQTNGGNLSQTGQFTVGMDTTVSTLSSTPGAPSGTISLDYVSYDRTQTPPALISNILRAAWP